MNITPKDSQTLQRVEEVFRRHAVENERMSYNLGDRPKEKIDAIIRDIQAANAEAEND